MKRRTFLKKTAAVAGASALAASTGPAFLNAEDKSGRKNTIIGKGEFTYEWIDQWGQLPDDIRWETTHGVCVDEAGLVYIKQQGLGKNPVDTLVLFHDQGKFCRSFRKE